MKILKIWNDSPSARQAEEIAAALEAGEIMVYPTDTLYALGCDALNPKAVDRLCSIKHINPAKMNLSVICADISMAAEYARIDNKAFRIIKNNTPGPFTFILKALSSLPRAFKGRKVVGVRIPDCYTDRMISEKLGRPILTSSIEYDDDDYAVNPDLIRERYENQAAIFVEGEEGSTELSTIVDLSEGTPEIIRQGKGFLTD
ncbi:MAG: threonylcarbamoyl-AMP synthase [Bacteroidales bacterium]|nr:threonylcarbamoyl-AMP synthase [Bacteroidales bacterium]